MWVAVASTCVTSSLFLTGLAPNLLALELAKKILAIDIGWTQWFIAFAPVGVVLLALVPLVTYWVYPPEVKEGREVPIWAAGELAKLGPLTRPEILLGGLVLLALGLWVFAANAINATTVALVVISLMLILKVVTWADIVGNTAAWNTLAWFATLVALADGLNRTGFVKWFADQAAAHMAGFSPLSAMIALVVLFYIVHYLFASVTAHVTALFPVFLAVGSTIPGMNMPQYALLLALTLGLMGIITPYGTGPSPVYYGSGYLPSSDWWRLGAIFGAIYLAAFLCIGVPWVMLISH
jgi:L-tartrate/succinate antiporter